VCENRIEKQWQAVDGCCHYIDIRMRSIMTLLRLVDTAQFLTAARARHRLSSRRLALVAGGAFLLLYNISIAGEAAGAGKFAKLVKNTACKNDTTVASCFQTLGRSITAGAIASLEPASTNLMSLPSPNIPGAPLSASSSTVSQDNIAAQTPSALIFFEDELISATCPNTALPYCTEGPKMGPQRVKDILHTGANDAVVALPSQTAGCAGACQMVLISSDLAHTTAPYAKYGKYLMDVNNVLESSAVNQQVAGWLSPGMPLRNAAKVILTNATPSRADAEPNYNIRFVDRLAKLPSGLTMGETFKLRIRYPRNKIKNVRVRMQDPRGGAGHGYDFLHVPLEDTPDGQTYALITPVLKGHITFSFNVDFTNYDLDSDVQEAYVAPPASPPAKFFGDCNLDVGSPNLGNQLPSVLGADGILSPCMFFASAPDKRIELYGDFTFKLLPSEGAPVIDLHPDGMFTPLRVGKATVQVEYAGFTTTIDVLVQPQ
jgi:hypothetical protein